MAYQNPEFSAVIRANFFIAFITRLIVVLLVLASSARADPNVKIPALAPTISDHDLKRLVLASEGLDEDLKELWPIVLRHGEKYLPQLAAIANSSRDGAAIPAICEIYVRADGDKSVALRSIREIIRRYPSSSGATTTNEKALSAAVIALGSLGEASDEQIVWKLLREERKLVFYTRIEWDCDLLDALGKLGDADCQRRIRQWIEDGTRGKTQSQVQEDLRFETAFWAISRIQFREVVKKHQKPAEKKIKPEAQEARKQ